MAQLDDKKWVNVGERAVAESRTKLRDHEAAATLHKT
jgi:hypothetical protein